MGEYTSLEFATPWDQIPHLTSFLSDHPERCLITSMRRYALFRYQFMESSFRSNSKHLHLASFK